MKDFIVRQGDEMLNFLIKKFDMINVYLKELEEYGSTSNADMGNMDNVDSIVQSLYDEDILYRKHYDYDTLYNLVWKAMDKAAKIANQKYNNEQINTNKEVMKINESQLRKIIRESIENVLSEISFSTANRAGIEAMYRASELEKAGKQKEADRKWQQHRKFDKYADDRYEELKDEKGLNHALEVSRGNWKDAYQKWEPETYNELYGQQ